MRSFYKLAALSVVGVASAFVAGSALASSWNYGGSKVTLEEDGAKRRITFAEPKSGLEKAGVKRGTVLFEGEMKKDNRVSGYAKLFKAGCDPLDYFVEGTIDGRKGEITLQGQAPVFSVDSCKIKGYSEDSSASTLTFTVQGGVRGTYADRGTEQGDGGYANGGRDAQRDPRDARGYDNRANNSNTEQPTSGQRDGYASNGDSRYDSRQGSTGGQYDNRQGSASGQYDSRDPRDTRQYDDPRDPRDRRYDDRAYSDREPAPRDYSRNGRGDYDPRADSRYDPRDDVVDDEPVEETTTYRYRTYRRSYPSDWRDYGSGR